MQSLLESEPSIAGRIERVDLRGIVGYDNRETMGGIRRVVEVRRIPVEAQGSFGAVFSAPLDPVRIKQCELTTPAMLRRLASELD